MDRERLLADWVEQPPAPPIVQYLRDAERSAALDLLDRRSPSVVVSEPERMRDHHVLDIASEANVTRELSAEQITRVDFSRAASETARETLGETVDRYETVEYDDPTLPLKSDMVTAAISVGPYDWRFLDRDRLTGEVHRVLRPGGRFVLTVPTPRSPYAASARQRLVYYTPAAAKKLFGPAWYRGKEKAVYQLPRQLHRLVAKLPASLQTPFVAASGMRTNQLNRREDVENASYLVLRGDAIDYEAYLDAALRALFRPVADDGFFHPDTGRIVRGLEYKQTGTGFEWTVDEDHQWRYPPMALMGILQWRTASPGDDRYDDRLRQALDNIASRLEAATLAELPVYGLGPLLVAYTLAAEIFAERNDEHEQVASYESVARRITDHTTGRVTFEHAEDSLALYGWTYRYERTGDSALRDAIEDGIWAVIERQDPSTDRFLFDNPTTQWHQNQQYTLWGLCRAIAVTGLDGYLENARRVLNDTVENRLRADGALLWDNPTRRDHLRYRARRVLGRTDGPPHWELLFACHQTFFINAVHHYRAAGGEQSFTTPVRRAANWLFGRNPRGQNLVELSGIGVPMRQMTTDGRLNTPGQKFKGTYEVGAYVAALTNLLQW